MRRRFRESKAEFEAVCIPGSDGSARVSIDGEQFEVSELRIDGSRLRFKLDDRYYEFEVGIEPQRVQLKQGTAYYSIERVEDGSRSAASAGDAALSSRMPGTVLRTLVEPGSAVTAGQALVILEAMKMEHTIEAPADGVVNSYPHAEGARVMPGDLLVDFSPADAD